MTTVKEMKASAAAAFSSSVFPLKLRQPRVALITTWRSFSLRDVLYASAGQWAFDRYGKGRRVYLNRRAQRRGEIRDVQAPVTGDHYRIPDML